MVTALKVPESFLRPVGHRGFSCTIAHSEGLTKHLRKRYSRGRLCLKVFERRRGKKQPLDMERHEWGPAPRCKLRTCTIVQNLCAMRGLAPRVYDVVIVNGNRIAQVTDYVSGTRGQIDKAKQSKLIRYARELGLHKHALRTFNHAPNWLGGNFVDFGSCCFVDENRYEKNLRAKIVHSNEHHNRKAYQPVTEMGIDVGRRDIRQREEWMRLAEVNFHRKDVLDLGCSLGAFGRLAARRGARRVVGVDNVQAHLAQEIANWLGLWNVDGLNLNLPGQENQIRPRKYDVVFCLAIVKHVGGWAPWIPALCKVGGIFYLEGHGKEGREKYEPLLKGSFREVEYLGKTTDLGTRSLFRCKR